MTRAAPKPAVVWTARAVTAVVSLALAEGVLWIGGYPSWGRQQVSSLGATSEYQPDPELGWTNRAGAFEMSAPDGSQFRYTNWSAGRRATALEIPAAKDPAVSDARARLAFIGDSYVYGYGLGDAETFAWRVQQRHPELEVSNYGTPGYGTYQSFLMMQRVFSGAAVPASVVYLFNGFHELRNTADPSWIRIPKKSADGGFFPFAVLAGGSIAGRRTDGDVIWSISDHLRTAAMVEEYYERAEAWTRVRNKRAVTQAILVKMNQLARSAGAKFTVVLFDDFQRPDREAYDIFLSSAGIAFIDCDHAELNQKGYRQPDGHPNAKLSELISRWVDPVSTVARNSARPQISSP